jgi:hypothetical protein
LSFPQQQLFSSADAEMRDDFSDHPPCPPSFLCRGPGIKQRWVQTSFGFESSAHILAHIKQFVKNFS